MKPRLRATMASLPNSSLTTTGRFSMPPTPRMATCGWLMMGKPITVPKTPGLVMVKVPPCTSSGESFLARARSARSPMRRASPTRESSSAFLTTGTMSPQGSATAMPRFTSPR